MTEYTDPKSISIFTITNKLRSSASYAFTLPHTNQEYEEYVNISLRALWHHLKNPYWSNLLLYSIKELVMNASKANLKRVHFQKKEATIENQSDYLEAIKTFQNAILSNFEEYSELLLQEELFVSVELAVKESSIIAKVTNNSKICDNEQNQINIRLLNTDSFNNLEQAFDYRFNSSEGRGLGLALVLLTLKKIGCNTSNLILQTQDESTKFILEIPLKLTSIHPGPHLTEQMREEINNMPMMAESITNLYDNLADPNSDFNSIAQIILGNQDLSSEIVRIANSIRFMLPHHVESVIGAVRMIGMRLINNFVLSYGITKIFKEKYNKIKIKTIMDHCYQVASISCFILQQKNLVSLRDDVYVAALLHDLGKIVIESIQPEFFEKVENFCQEKKIPLVAIEDLTAGYNHAFLGELLAEKWKIPKKFIQCIKYHHRPLECEVSYKALVYTIYLGNELYYYIHGQRFFCDINPVVLRYFNLTEKQKIKIMVQKIRELELV